MMEELDYITLFDEDGNEEKMEVIDFFKIEDLNQEYTRIKKIHIGEVLEIMYVNITEPYYYFTVKDPEGNLLEICGDNYAGI